MNGLVPRCARLLVAGWLLLCAPWAAAGMATVAEIERHLRGQPEQALAALQQLLPTLRGAARVEALVVRGGLLIRVHEPAAIEEVAEELDRLAVAERQPLATAAAGLLRARAVARGGPAGRADRMLA